MTMTTQEALPDAGIRAILDATGFIEDVAPLAERIPTPLIPICNKPIIHYVIEYLVEQGIRDIHIVRCHFPERISEALGEGERWGAKFTYHLTREPKMVYQTIRTICEGWDDEVFLMGRADKFPLFDLQVLRRFPELPAPVATRQLFEDQDERAMELTWSGWALVRPGDVTADLYERMSSICSDENPETHRYDEAAIALSTRRFEAILFSSRIVLNGVFPNLRISERQVEPGVIIGRNVVIHPTAHVVPPICIGDNSRLGASITVGPLTSIGENCILEDKSTIEESIVMQGSYVGEGLEVRRSIIDHNLLVNANIGTAINVSDEFLLGSVQAISASKILQSICSRVIAAGLLVATFPFMLLVALLLKVMRGQDKVFVGREFVSTPTQADAMGWRSFKLWSFGCDPAWSARRLNVIDRLIFQLHLNYWPALVNIVRGQIGFVGIKPRTREELEATPSDWRQTIMKTKAGVVTLATAQYGPTPTNDELYASELYYCATSHWVADVKLISGLGFERIKWKEKHQAEAATFE